MDEVLEFNFNKVVTLRVCMVHTVMEDNPMEKFFHLWMLALLLWIREAPNGFIEIDYQALPSAIGFVISFLFFTFVSITVDQADFWKADTM